MNIKTESGNVTLEVPDMKRVDGLRDYLPLAGPLAEKPAGAGYGIVMKQGANELWGLKQESAEFDQRQAKNAVSNNAALIVLALKQYLSIGFSGVLMPCVYSRPKKAGNVEVGVAYFGNAEPVVARKGAKAAMVNSDVGHDTGFSEMVAGFMSSMFEASGKSGIPLRPIIGLDHRPRSALGSICLMFLIHGKDLYSLHVDPESRNPVWTVLRSMDIRRAWSLPCVPLEIPAAKKGCRHGI